MQLDAEISARAAECGWWMLCERRKIARLRRICESYSGKIKRNKKTADDLGLILLANTGILDVHSEYRTRYRPQAYRDKCRITSTALDPHDKLEIGNRQPYQLTVIDSRTPDNMHHQGE